MTEKVAMYAAYKEVHDSYIFSNELLLPQSPFMAKSSEIELLASAISVTPPQPNRSTIPYHNDSYTEAIVSCSSTSTDDMLDTVDDCVGCVNQISLQHDFEDSIRDMPMHMHYHSNGMSTPPSDDNAIDAVSSAESKEIGSLFHSNSFSIEEEHVKQHESEINLLNWCSGGFQGK